jgi:hypothetical protein
MANETQSMILFVPWCPCGASAVEARARSVMDGPVEPGHDD